MGADCSCCCNPDVERSRGIDHNDANGECVEATVTVRFRGRSASNTQVDTDCEIDASDNDSDYDGNHANCDTHIAYHNKDCGEELRDLPTGTGDSPGADELQKKYILYPDPESPPASGTARNLWEERLAFLRMRPRLAQTILEDLNKVRTGNDLYVVEQRVGDLADVKTGKEQLQVTERMLADLNSARAGSKLSPLTVSDRLSRVALQVWLERSEVADGFVAIPGCAYKGLGCLTYYSPRTRPYELDCLSKALVHFLLNGGRHADTVFSAVLSGSAYDEATYFPSSGELYTHRSNYVFRDCASRFVPQLLKSDCRSLGLYMDMVQTEERQASRNIVCLVLIFDKMPPLNCA